MRCYLPMIIRYIIKHPILVITTQSWVAAAPKGPKASLMTPEYVVVSPERVNLIKNSTEISASKAITRTKTKAGITPRTFRVAGRDMIPAPITLVATLNTAPETVAGFKEVLDPDKRGAFAPITGDIPATMKEKIWESFVTALLCFALILTRWRDKGVSFYRDSGLNDWSIWKTRIPSMNMNMKI